MNRTPHEHATVAAARTLLTAILAALLLGALAFGKGEAAFVRSGDTLTGPDTIPAGYTLVTFDNGSDQPYELTLIRLRDGVGYEQVDELAAASEDGSPDSLRALMEAVEIYGGVAAVPPGASGNTGITLAEGRYLAFSENFEGGVEVRLAFEVAGSSGAEAPAVDREVTMWEFAFDLGADIPAGEQRWRVTNIGAQMHHLMIFPIQPGTTLDDVEAALSEPGEPTFIIGPPAVMSATFGGGISNDLTVDLAPGSYAAICFVPDLETGLPHAALGMLALIEVTDN
jgi:hypothetical protein